MNKKIKQALKEAIHRNDQKEVDRVMDILLRKTSEKEGEKNDR